MHRVFDLWWVFYSFIFEIVESYIIKITEISKISELKACEENTGQNGGKCKEAGTDDYSCLCPIGFTGKNCECKYNDLRYKE